MSTNYGKAFEAKLKQDFLASIPNSTIDRIYDTVNGLKGISNISDFIGFRQPAIYYIEAKTHAGASLPIENITQYKKLKDKVSIPGVRAGVVLWLYEKDVVLYIPISTVTKLINDGEKSVGIRHLGKYNIKEIPSTKKRVFMDSDYSILLDLEDGE